MTQPDPNRTILDNNETVFGGDPSGGPTLLDNRDVELPTILGTPINPPPPPSPSPNQAGGGRFPIWVLLLLAGLLLLICLVVAGALLIPRFLNADPTPTATATMMPLCTPPPCPAEGTLMCGTDSCPGGCGTICVLAEATETPFFEASPTATNEPPTVTPIATETPLAQITPQAGDERIADEDDMVQLFVPAGEYLMGASANDPSASPEEMPAHFVTLDPFWIDKFEVTNAQYVAFLNEKGNSLDCFGENCMAVQPDEPNAPIFLIMNGFAVEDELAFHPATYVSWYGAAAYCQSVGRRLPTEAEWEFAARGTDGRIYPWGNLFEKSALNYCDQSCDSAYNDASFNDGFAETAPVGTYPTGVSPFGAMDMGGNVWEWAADWYGADFYNVSRVSNPLGPDSGEHKVLRGGAFGFVREGNWRTTDRGLSAPDFIAPDIGFRCVADE